MDTFYANLFGMRRSAVRYLEVKEPLKKMLDSAVSESQSKRRVRSSAAGEKRDKAEHGTSLLTAFQEIRELIVHGKMSPGTWIVEADLAARLNMSRTPIRGAIHWLQREGYVLEQRHVSKSRMIVAPLTKDDANELYLIIGRIEGIAGRGAAQLAEPLRVQLASKLSVVNEELLAIADGRNSHAGRIFDLDRNFHRLIVKTGAGARLTTLHKAVEPQAERYWRLYASSIIKDLHLSIKEHAGIIEAIQAGDAAAVERRLQINWQKGAERLGHVIDIFGERGSW
jgi:DNA-binding GntR family transcriptional regulator